MTFDLWLTLIWDSEELEEYRRIRRLVNFYRLTNSLGKKDGIPNSRFRFKEVRTAMNELSSKVRELYEEGYDVSPKERGKMLFDILKLGVPAGEAEKIYAKAGKLFSDSGFVSKFPNVNPEAEPALRALKSRFPKIKIGLISNAARSASTYRRILSKLGISSYFDELIISCEIGYLKPRREIFERALSALSVRPEETVHIGDLFQADVIGAASCRMNACLYTGLWHRYAQYTNPGEHIARDFRPARTDAIVQEIEKLQQVVEVAERIP